jgi:hypothetical protein
MFAGKLGVDKVMLRILRSEADFDERYISSGHHADS